MPSHYGGNRRMNGNNGRRTTRSTTNNNPVTELFNAPQSPRYYRPDGSVVPIGAPLHRHANGTIMTKHSMGSNDNSQVVTTTRNATASRTPNRRVNRMRYTFVDTGEEYIGRVVEIGGIIYSTEGGTKEGTSREVERSTNNTSTTRSVRRTLPRRNRTTPTRTNTTTLNRRTTQRTRNSNMRRSSRRVNRQTTNMNNGTRRTMSTPMRTTRTTRRSGGY
tara:strand:- start:425 stop:1081 length:657 start_codon:yes stop_codon:yes gene_type:complete